MENIITRTIKTKLDADGIQHEICVHMDFTDISQDTILEWASKDRAIVFQNNNRKTMSVVDYMALDGKTIKVDDLCKSTGGGRKPRVMTPDEQITFIKALSETERAAYIEKLMGAL